MKKLIAICLFALAILGTVDANLPVVDSTEQSAAVATATFSGLV